MIPAYVLESAESDISSGMAWYNHCRRHHPAAYAPVYKNIQRILIRRFPYGIFYRIDTMYITVIAVLHTHRNPSEQWK